MPKSVFIYICCCVVLLQLYSLSSEWVNNTINIISMTGILTLGIAHGSIDHVLFQKDRKLNVIHFLSIYVLILVLNFSLWFILPLTALLIFLGFSAYHFGQSQFVDLLSSKKPSSKIIFLLWGSAILSGLLFFNETEVINLFSSTQEALNRFNQILPYTPYVFFGSLTLTIILIAFQVHLNAISLNAFGLELVQLLIILTSFYLFPAVLGFSLYFIILHSFRVLSQEYKYLRQQSKIDNKRQFTNLLLPFTITSILGLVLLIALVFYFNLKISLPYLLVALTSAVTIPHAMVMEIFYSNSKP